MTTTPENKQLGQIVAAPRHGVVINGVIRAIHHAVNGCGDGYRNLLLADDWTLVTCRRCLRRLTIGTPPRPIDGQLPPGVRFSERWHGT